MTLEIGQRKIYWGQCKYSSSKAPENSSKIFKQHYVVTYVLWKSTFSLTEVIRKTEEHKGNLIKIFKFIMALKTLGNQGL